MANQIEGHEVIDIGRSRKRKIDPTPWLEPEGLELIRCWARDYALTDIPQKMGISYETFKAWRREFPEFAEALSVGREVIDYQVENALLKTALGYTTRRTKVVMELDKLTGELQTTKKESTIEEVAPNPTAIMAWLNNRRPDRWKRNRDGDSTRGKEDINITIVQKRDDEPLRTSVKQSEDSEWDEMESELEEVTRETDESTKLKSKPTKQSTKSVVEQSKREKKIEEPEVSYENRRSTKQKSKRNKQTKKAESLEAEWDAIEDEEEW